MHGVGPRGPRSHSNLSPRNTRVWTPGITPVSGPTLRKASGRAVSGGSPQPISATRFLPPHLTPVKEWPREQA